MKEINYKEMRFNPFNLIGGEWMLVTAFPQIFLKFFLIVFRRVFRFERSRQSGSGLSLRANTLAVN